MLPRKSWVPTLAKPINHRVTRPGVARPYAGCLLGTARNALLPARDGPMACLERLSRFPADERTAYLDDQIITAPTGKCAMQTGTFRYKSKMDENKTVPANRITDRQVNCRSRHRRTHGANGRRNNRDCPRTLTVRETACRRLPDREGDLRQTWLRPEISSLSPVCSSLSPVSRGLSGGHRAPDGLPRAEGAAATGGRNIRYKTSRAAPSLLRGKAPRGCYGLKSPYRRMGRITAGGGVALIPPRWPGLCARP